jgi:hypothetical protein
MLKTGRTEVSCGKYKGVDKAKRRKFYMSNAAQRTDRREKTYVVGMNYEA